MTIPYLPGWWDEISRSATSFASQLPQFIQPDAVANKKLQELIQQNPMLLSQVENMTPEARMAMEQSLGFKKKTPLQGLPVGAQLRGQMEEAEFIKSLTPEQREIRLASKTGTKTQAQILREQQKFDQELQNGTLQNQVLTGQVKDINRVQAQIDAAAEKYPNLQGMKLRDIAKQAVRGNGQIDPQLMTAIQADPGAKQLFEIAYGAELNLFKNDLDKQLAKTKSPETQSLLLRTLAEIGNQLNDQEMRTMAEMQAQLKLFEDAASNPLNPNMMKYMTNADLKQKDQEALLAPYRKRLEEIRKAATENTARTTQLVTGMGITAPQPPAPITQTPTNETPEQRLARLRKAAGGM